MPIPTPDYIVNQPLSVLTTMGLGGTADYYFEISQPDDLIHLEAFAKSKKLPLLILGGGSNIVFSDEGFQGVIGRLFSPEDSHLSSISEGDKEFVRVPASFQLDHLASWCVRQGLSGLSCLSGIPGTVGAAPIQNVGAYGTEIGNLIVELRVFDRRTRSFFTMQNDSCQFGYRSSIFQKKKNLIIWDVTICLRNKETEKIRHGQLLNDMGGNPVELAHLRKHVLDIRRKKGMLAECHFSCGSFFKNPVLNKRQCQKILKILGLDCPVYDQGDNTYKVPAAYLIEKAGYSKGEIHKGVGLSPHHALALIQDGTGSAISLLNLAREIVVSVQNQFGIRLLPEPLLLDAKGHEIQLLDR